jgi:serine/threonine protein phosphatase 1
MKRYLILPENTRGEDYIFPDLHGCVDLLYRKLDEVNFDPAIDRAMLAGDLCDRGDKSLETLEVVGKPGIFCVPGNHDGMLLTFLGLRTSAMHRPSDFLFNGGHWVEHLTSSERDRLDTVAKKIAELPMAIIVRGERPYNVVHGDLTYLNMSQLELERSETIAPEIADHVLWSRELVHTAEKPTAHQYDGQTVYLSEEPIAPGLNMTYVGHTILRDPLVHRSHIFIDQGAYVSTKPNAAVMHPSARLQMIKHRQFSDWLAKTMANK